MACCCVGVRKRSQEIGTLFACGRLKMRLECLVVAVVGDDCWAFTTITNVGVGVVHNFHLLDKVTCLQVLGRGEACSRERLTKKREMKHCFHGQPCHLYQMATTTHNQLQVLPCLVVVVVSIVMSIVVAGWHLVQGSHSLLNVVIQSGLGSAVIVVAVVIDQRARQAFSDPGNEFSHGGEGGSIVGTGFCESCQESRIQLTAQLDIP